MLVKRPSVRDGLHTFRIAFGREWLRCVPQAIEELSGWAASDQTLDAPLAGMGCRPLVRTSARHFPAAQKVAIVQLNSEFIGESRI